MRTTDGDAQVQFPRPLAVAAPLLTGDDVKRAQALLGGGVVADGVYGPATAEATRRAKLALGYPDAACDGVFDATLGTYLARTAIPPADFAARAAARAAAPAGTAPVAPAGASVRDRIVAVARWGIANEAQIHYAQQRPIDGVSAPAPKLPLSTDCSGFATLCYRWAGAPDPHGRGFDGQGYTGTLLQKGRVIAAADALPGDMVVWGAAPGTHVALVLEAGPDPLLCSHGQEKGPVATRFSNQNAYHGPPATFLRFLA